MMSLVLALTVSALFVGIFGTLTALDVAWSIRAWRRVRRGRPVMPRMVAVRLSAQRLDITPAWNRRNRSSTSAHGAQRDAATGLEDRLMKQAGVDTFRGGRQ